MNIFRLSYCGLLLVPFIALIPDRNGTSLTLLLILMSGAAWLQQGAPLPPLRQQKVVAGILVAYATALGLNIFLVSEPTRIDPLHQSLRAGTYLAPIAGLLTLLALANITLPWRRAYLAFPFAAIASGLMALFQRLVLSVHRAEGFTNAILFSDICVVLVAVALATRSLWAISERAARILFWSSTLLGICAIIMSGSRGSWLAIPVLGGLLIHGQLSARPKLYWRSMAGLIVSLPLTYLFPMVKLRVDLAIVEVSRYFHEAHIHSSVGARLEIWRISVFELFPQNPWFGVGIHQFKTALNTLAENRAIDPSFTWISHPHNEWLYVLVEQGLVGVFALLTLYGGSYFIMSHSLKNHDQRQPLLLAARCLYAGMLIFGMTDVMMGNLITATFFCGMMCWLSLCSNNLKRPILASTK
ncbi:O-antigen ligase domain-containing protein [Corallincola holothuriorum]|uniref:O-antigen ligase domain-containing protein n=1 Tax=Corallincola holothuriorum TaxID=2282215 RepID=A0A368NRF1_9GAMM|nr:O-antigen ligase family protein [Corallincola holothuriorum]RCU51841.1 O-antigen ligase domain-containing protein [Corallincola holothuriorum]